MRFLHTENFIAVAQKNYTYVYDNLGTELHCLKTMYDTARLEFLPRHFLLVGSSRNSFLNYIDVSVGKQIVSFATKSGTLDVMCQNPANAIIHTGHTNGTVSLWSPNSKEPLVKVLAHLSAVKGVAVDDQGNYMATTGLDRKCRIWDVRMFRQLHSYSLPFGVSDVAISQKLDVACAVGNNVQVFRGMHNGTCKEPYLVHNCGGNVTDVRFVPWEDVLGVGHANGFTSMLVPGSGDPNVDTLRSNPYETKSQRKEREIKQLLDKVSVPEVAPLTKNAFSSNQNSLVSIQMTLTRSMKDFLSWRKKSGKKSFMCVPWPFSTHHDTRCEARRADGRWKHARTSSRTRFVSRETWRSTPSKRKSLESAKRPRQRRSTFWTGLSRAILLFFVDF